MNSILKTLFLSDIQFVPDENLECQSAEALDGVLQAEKAVRKGLSSEQWKLVTGYLERVQLTCSLDSQLHFKRGFLLGSQLMTEILLTKVSLTY